MISKGIALTPYPCDIVEGVIRSCGCSFMGNPADCSWLLDYIVKQNLFGHPISIDHQSTADWLYTVYIFSFIYILCVWYCVQCTPSVHTVYILIILYSLWTCLHTHTYWNLSHLQLARSPNLDRKYVNEMYILSWLVMLNAWRLNCGSHNGVMSPFYTIVKFSFLVS